MAKTPRHFQFLCLQGKHTYGQTYAKKVSATVIEKLKFNLKVIALKTIMMSFKKTENNKCWQGMF